MLFYLLRRWVGAIAAIVGALLLIASLPLFIPSAPMEGNPTAWLFGFLRGDLGVSLRTDAPVAEQIARAWSFSVVVLLLAVLISFAIALPLGTILAMRGHRAIARFVRFLGVAGLSLPYVCLLLVAMVLRPQLTSLLSELNWQRLIVPALLLAVPFTAVQLAMVQSVVLGAMRPYGQLRGQPKVSLPHAFLPVWSNLALQVGSLIGGLIALELIFNLPGLGSLMVRAVVARDMPMFLALASYAALACALLTSATYIWYLFVEWFGYRVQARHTEAQLVHGGKVSLVLGAVLVVLLSVPLLVGGGGDGALQLSLRDRLQEPSAEHWMGTDELGRDRFSQLLAGGRTTLVTSALGASLALVIGSAVGAVAGGIGGVAARAVVALLELVVVIPAVLLAMLFASAREPGTAPLVAAIAVLCVPGFVRTVATAVSRWLASRREGQAERLGFASVVLPMLGQFCLAISLAVALETLVSFVGVGVQPPDASLGNLLSSGMRTMMQSSVGVLVPALWAIGLCFGFNLLGDALFRLKAGLAGWATTSDLPARGERATLVQNAG
jgi:peptide/nickel transport system permease protein